MTALRVMPALSLIVLLGASGCTEKPLDARTHEARLDEAPQPQAEQRPRSQPAPREERAKLDGILSQQAPGALADYALEGCDEELRGCLNLATLRSTPGASSQILSLARSTPDPAARLRWIRLAFLTANQVQETERIEEFFLENAGEYISTGTPAQQASLRELTLLALEGVKRRGGRLPQATSQALLKLGGDWSPAELARLRGLIVQTEQLAAGQLSGGGDAGRLLLAEIQAVNLAFPLGLKGIGLGSYQSPKPFTPAQILFDQVWRGVVELEAGSVRLARMAGTVQERRKLQLELMAYLELRFALSLFQTQEQMQRYLAEAKGINSATVLEKAMTEGGRIATVWEQIRGRMDNLRLLYERALRVGQTETRESERQIQTFYAALGSNITAYSTYPHMILVAYAMARHRLSMRIITFTGVVEIDAAQIMRWLIRAETSPWFAYSQDSVSLNSAQVLSVFGAMFRTGLFEAAGIPIADLIDLFLTQTVAQEAQRISAFQKNIIERTEANFEYRAAIAACRRVQTAKPGEKWPSPPRSLLSVLKYAYAGLPDRKTPMATNQDVREYVRHTNRDSHEMMYQMTQVLLGESRQGGFDSREMIESMRIDFEPRLRTIEVLRDLAVAHATDVRGQAAGEELGKSLDAKLEPYRKMLSEYRQSLRRVLAEVIPCTLTLLKAEQRAQNAVTAAVIEHLGKVHERMEQIRSSAGGLSQEFGLSERYGGIIQGLREHEAALGVTGDVYRISAVQLALRVREWLQGSVLEPGGITLPGRIRELDERVGGTDNSEMREQVVDIPFIDSREEFINGGLRLLYRRGQLQRGFLAHYSRLKLSLYAPGLIETLVTAVKAGGAEPIVSASDTIKVVGAIFDFIALDDVGRDLAQRTQWQHRLVSRSDLYDWALESRSGRPIGLADQAFGVLGQDVLGYKPNENDGAESRRRQMNVRVGNLETIRTFFLQSRDPGHQIFADLAKGRELVAARYDRLLADELSVQVAFLEASAQEEAKALPAWVWSLGEPPLNRVYVSAQTRRRFASTVGDYLRDLQRPAPELIRERLTRAIGQ